MSISEVLFLHVDKCYYCYHFKMKTTQNHKLYVNKVDIFQFCFGLPQRKKTWSHALLAEWLLQHKLILMY